MPNLDPREFEMLMNQARIKLPGSSDAGVKAELFDVCKEFFNDSMCWYEDIKFQAEANKQHYRLVPRFDGQIISLGGVWDDKGIPVAAFMHQFTDVRLVCAPNSTPPSEWFARVYKTVVVPTTKDSWPIVPDWTLRVYSIHILDGLLGKMMGQQHMSYSNLPLSTYHLRRFRAGIQIARVAAENQNVRGAQAWSFPRGWSSRSQRGGVSQPWPGRVF